MEIRFLNSEDTAAYVALRKYSLSESPYAFSDSSEDEENKTLSDYESEIKKWGDPLEAFTLGAFSEAGELVGFVKLKRDQRTKARHRAMLHSLYVKPDFRRQGIATQLISRVSTICETISGIEQLQLAAIVSHSSQIEFYEKSGFKKLGGLIEKDLIINGTYTDAWYMVKHLNTTTMNKIPSSNYKVRFHDCDMFGHLNNARYLDYMISARQDHLKDAYNFDYNSYYKNSLGWVISHHEIQYLKPAFFEETVVIQSSLLNVDADSLVVEVLMMNEAKTHLKAILKSRLTFINLNTGRKEQHAPEFLEWANLLVLEDVHPETPLQERINRILSELKRNVVPINHT